MEDDEDEAPRPGTAAALYEAFRDYITEWVLCGRGKVEVKHLQRGFVNMRGLSMTKGHSVKDVEICSQHGVDIEMLRREFLKHCEEDAGNNCHMFQEEFHRFANTVGLDLETAKYVWNSTDVRKAASQCWDPDENFDDEDAEDDSREWRDTAYDDKFHLNDFNPYITFDEFILHLDACRNSRTWLGQLPWQRFCPTCDFANDCAFCRERAACADCTRFQFCRICWADHPGRPGVDETKLVSEAKTESDSEPSSPSEDEAESKHPQTSLDGSDRDAEHEQLVIRMLDEREAQRMQGLLAQEPDGSQRPRRGRRYAAPA